jgi:hypothetical protein
MSASGSRIAFIDSGNLWVRDGVSGTGYNEMAGGVTQYAVTPTAVVVRSGGTVYAKAGLTDTWTTLAGNATDIQASANRIAFIDSGNLWVRDGVGGTGYNETSGVSQFAVTPTLLVVRGGSSMSAKAGLTDSWTSLTAGATDMKASGNRIAFVDGNGHLWAKDGIQGTWYDETSGFNQYAIS